MRQKVEIYSELKMIIQKNCLAIVKSFHTNSGSVYDNDCHNDYNYNANNKIQWHNKGNQKNVEVETQRPNRMDTSLNYYTY